MLQKGLKKLFQKINISGWGLILLGSFFLSLTMVKSGLLYSFGMGFWGPNGHDGVWHISLIRSLSEGSWKIPVFAGEIIKNYHIGFDLLLAVLYKLTLIPIQILYFQVIPPILAILIGIFVFLFVLEWRGSKTCAWWSTFYLYFGGGWGWFLTLIRQKRLNGESLFWAQQSISTLVNPPFALSLLLIFIGLFLLLISIKTKNRNLLIVAAFLFGILIQIKIYGGILILLGLFASGIYNIFKRKGIFLMKVFTSSLIVSILLLPGEFSHNMLIFRPFWFLEEMLATPDRLYWPKMASAIFNYKLSGDWGKLFLAYALTFVIFWFGNLGTRVIKEPLVFDWLKNIRRASWLEVFFISVIAFGIVIPTFFIQSGTPWNTIQFLYYSLIFSGILAGIYIGRWLERQKKATNRFIAKGLIVLLTIPTTIGTLWFHYLPSRPPAKISNEELEALYFLSKQPKGTVLTQPFDKEMAQEAIKNPPRPLYLYESTAYVSAFSGQQVFLEDEVNLEITGYDWRERRKIVESFFENPTKDFLLKNGIEYVYLIKDCKTHNLELINLEKLFENDEVCIYTLKKG